MNTIRAFILPLILLTFTSPAWSQDCKGREQAVATVNGMVCDFCVQSLKKVFLKDPAVETVDIDLTTKHVTITMKQGKTLDDQAIAKVVEWGGYEMTGVTRSCS